LGDYYAIHLAWLPLVGESIDLTKVRYLAGSSPTRWSPQAIRRGIHRTVPTRWSPKADDSIALFGKETNLQSISAAFLKGPQKWIVLHMTANDNNCPTGPIVARIGTPPFDWSDEFRLFDPCRERAYGRYMHWPDLDAIQVADPHREPPKDPNDPDERLRR